MPEQTDHVEGIGEVRCGCAVEVTDSGHCDGCSRRVVQPDPAPQPEGEWPLKDGARCGWCAGPCNAFGCVAKCDESQKRRLGPFWGDPDNSASVEERLRAIAQVAEQDIRGVRPEFVSPALVRIYEIAKAVPADAGRLAATKAAAEKIRQKAASLPAGEREQRLEAMGARIELAKKRASEAREVAIVLGVLRLHGSVDRDFAERKLEITLDRLHRIQEGEDYIEQWEDLNLRFDGCNFSPPHPDALPPTIASLPADQDREGEQPADIPAPNWFPDSWSAGLSDREGER